MFSLYRRFDALVGFVGFNNRETFFFPSFSGRYPTHNTFSGVRTMNTVATFFQTQDILSADVPPIVRPWFPFYSWFPIGYDTI